MTIEAPTPHRCANNVRASRRKIPHPTDLTEVEMPSANECLERSALESVRKTLASTASPQSWPRPVTIVPEPCLVHCGFRNSITEPRFPRRAGERAYFADHRWSWPGPNRIARVSSPQFKRDPVSQSSSTPKRTSRESAAPPTPSHSAVIKHPPDDRFQQFASADQAPRSTSLQPQPMIKNPQNPLRIHPRQTKRVRDRRVPVPPRFPHILSFMSTTPQSLSQNLQNRINALAAPKREIFHYMFRQALSNARNIPPEAIAESQIRYLEDPNTLASKSTGLTDYLINIHYKDIIYNATLLNPFDPLPPRPETLQDAIALSQTLKSKT